MSVVTVGDSGLPAKWLPVVDEDRGSVIGPGGLLTTGATAEAVKARFAWARGGLAVRVRDLKRRLP